MFCDSLREKYADRPVELEDVRYPDYQSGKILATTAAFPKCMYTLMPKVDMYAKDQRKSSLGRFLVH